MTECQLTRKLTKLLKQQGAVIFACVGGELQEAGWPDRWICWRGKSCWVEFKSATSKLSRIQAYQIKRLRQAGAAVCVARFVGNSITFESHDGSILCDEVPWSQFLEKMPT